MTISKEDMDEIVQAVLRELDKRMKVAARASST